MVYAGGVYNQQEPSKPTFQAMNDRLPLPLLVTLGLILAMLILWFDLSDSYGIVEGVAYISLILLSLASGKIKYVYLTAVLATVLSCIGLLITVENNPWWVMMINRGLALLVIWITAVLGVKFLRREINLRTLIDTTVDGIVTVDTRCRIRTFNRAAQMIFGYKTDEVVNRDVSLLLPGVHGEDQKSSIRRFLKQDGGHSVARGLEVEGLCKDGTVLILELSVAEYEDGDDVHYLLMIRDISEQKRVEENFRKEHQFNVQLVKMAPVIILTLDTEGRIIHINPYLEELSQYRLEEVQGEDWFTTFLPEDERGQIRQMFNKSVSGVRTQGNINSILSRSGKRFLIEWFDTELFDSEGRLIGILAIGMDISERRDTEKRIRDLQKEILLASRMSAIGELGTALSHELNQPLTALANYVHACKRMLDDDSTTGKEALAGIMEKVINEADRAASIIVNLRNYFEYGAIEKHREDINAIILDVCELVVAETEKRRVSIRRNLERNLPPVLIDRIQIQQVLSNLLNNSLQALEHQVKREITINTIRGQEGFVEVNIQDSGPGFDPDLLLQKFKHVFSENKQGLGVGLSICQSIIDAHGGRLWQTVTPRGGATFHFTVPVVTGVEHVG
jgi:two-component system sensor kinase FixL